MSPIYSQGRRAFGDPARRTENHLQLLYFEELPLGGEWTTRRRTLSEADLAAFSGVAGDFNPLHVDRPHAAGSHFGAVVAHAGLVASAAIGLGSMDAPLPATVGLLEMSWKFLRPVRAGDSIRSRWRLARKRPLEGRPWGVAVWQVEVENQDGVKVAEGELTRLVATRSSEAAGVAHVEDQATAEAATPARRRRRRGRGGRSAAEAVLDEPQPEPETADVPPAARRTRRRRGGGQGEPVQSPPPQQAEAPPVEAPAAPTAPSSSRRRRRRRSGGGNGGGESTAGSASDPGPAPEPPPAPAQPRAGSRSGRGLGGVLRRLRGGS